MAGPVINGAMTLGPAPSASSGPTTMAAYLTSIGKDSFYGGYRAGMNMYSTADNSSPVTDGQNVRRWVANWTAGSWAAEFTQGSSPKRPVYGASRNGQPGIYGDGSGWYMTLNSTTVLNRTYTVLMSTWATFATNGNIYSHSNNQIQLRAPSALANDALTFVAAVGGSSVSKSVETTPVSGATAVIRAGIVSSGTTFYNTAPVILANSGDLNHTSSTIHEIWLIGAALTPREISTALQYLL